MKRIIKVGEKGLSFEEAIIQAKENHVILLPPGHYAKPGKLSEYWSIGSSIEICAQNGQLGSVTLDYSFFTKANVELTFRNIIFEADRASNLLNAHDNGTIILENCIVRRSQWMKLMN